jgi:hypothetical protein
MTGLNGKAGKDTIVLADFENKTGDPVLDDALKQALMVDLGQSPFLRKKFQGDETAELDVLSRVDNTHPSTAQFFDDVIVRDGPADHELKC